MKRFVFAFIVAAILMILTTDAYAGCGNCDFPMAKLYGKWEAGHNELVLQQRSRRGDVVIVDVALIDTRTGDVIGRGHGVGNVGNTDLRVQLGFKDGQVQIFMLSVGEGSGRLHVNFASSAQDEKCTEDFLCADFNQTVSASAVNEDEMFAKNPDEVEDARL